jgi:hypothetical protein
LEQVSVGTGTGAALTWEQVTAALAGSADPAVVVALFKGRSEAERLALVPRLRGAQALGGPTYPLRLVGVACLDGPGPIAGWLSGPELGWDVHGGVASIAEVIADRDPEWVVEVARRMVAEFFIDDPSPWAVVEELVVASGMPTPTTDVFLDTWVTRRSRRGLADVRPFARPCDDELAECVAGYLSRLSDPWSSGEQAQSVLRRLDEAGWLTADQVAAAIRAAPTRRRKRFLHTGLWWLSQAIARHPDHVGTLLAALGPAFDSGYPDLQEYAVRLLGRHIGALTADRVAALREELWDRLPRLADGPRAAATAVLGSA